MMDCFNLNIVLSISKAFVLTFGPPRLIANIVATVSRKDQPMFIRNGISTNVDLMWFYPKKEFA